MNVQNECAISVNENIPNVTQNLKCGPLIEKLEDDEDEESKDISATHGRDSDNRWDQSSDDHYRHRFMGKYQRRGERYNSQLVVHLARKLLMTVNGRVVMATAKSKPRRESRLLLYRNFIQDWLWLLGYLLKRFEIDQCY